MRGRRYGAVVTTRCSTISRILPMMLPMRERLLIGTCALAASIAILGVGSATAVAAVAKTGSATDVTATSAVLNGTVAPTDKTAGDVAWTFDYGTSSSYGLSTKHRHLHQQPGLGDDHRFDAEHSLPLRARRRAGHQLQPDVQLRR